MNCVFCKGLEQLPHWGGAVCGKLQVMTGQLQPHTGSSARAGFWDSKLLSDMVCAELVSKGRLIPGDSGWKWICLPAQPLYLPRWIKFCNFKRSCGSLRIVKMWFHPSALTANSSESSVIPVEEASENKQVTSQSQWSTWLVKHFLTRVMQSKWRNGPVFLFQLTFAVVLK